MVKPKPLISVIIPTKNEEKNIKRCLEGIQSAIINHPAYAGRQPSAIEIIIVDNYSKDRTVELAKKYTKNVFQKGPERSTQRNFGAKKANGKILFFIDADMEIDKRTINQAIERLKKNPKIKGIIVPEISTGKNYWARVRTLERSCYLGSLVEAARIFDRKTFLRVGGFDNNLIAAEDWDLSQRVKKLGKIGRINAKITHHEGKLSLVGHLKKKYYYGKNIQYYAKKHPQKFRAQSGAYRVRLLLKNWKKLVADPIHALGVFILKSLEYSVFLWAKIK